VELILTKGPRRWISFKGTHSLGDYFGVSVSVRILVRNYDQETSPSETTIEDVRDHRISNMNNLVYILFKQNCSQSYLTTFSVC
jgi:hypothetical protein